MKTFLFVPLGTMSSVDIGAAHNLGGSSGHNRVMFSTSSTAIAGAAPGGGHSVAGSS